jgi:hypothetical protein
MISTDTLDAIRFCYEQVFAESALRNLKHSVDVVEMHAQYVAACLEVLVYGSPAEDYEECRHVPADWWSHFKLWASMDPLCYLSATHRWNRPWWRRALRLAVLRLKPPVMQDLVFTARGNLVFPTIQVDRPSVRVVETNLHTVCR